MQKLLNIFRDSTGKAQLIILTAVVAMALLLGGGLFGKRPPLSEQTSQTPTLSSCCDTGDGDACQVQTGTGKTLTYKGKEYGLIRTKVIPLEGNLHFKDSGDKDSQGNPIIINVSDVDNNVNLPNTQGYNQYCRKNTNDDTYFKKLPSEEDKRKLATANTPDEFRRLLQTYCISTPNDQMIFVCLKDCHPAACPEPYLSLGASCYGSENSEYNVYFKVEDKNNIPDFIKNCDKSVTGGTEVSTTTAPQIVFPTEISPGPRKNLQLKTFTVVEERMQQMSPWLSPFCKPAIYLYPEQKTDVSVIVKPQGKMTYTIPQYPAGGWKVTAYPDGKIDYQNASFDYLYYEAEIPNTSYEKPESGFVVEKANMQQFLTSLLPKLGLNQKETSEFASYWVKVLPDSPYFFVGIIPQTTLDSIAPLSITPKPKSVIRVALYFEALEKKVEVVEPIIKSPTRTGFTVVEWGGIFKRDPKRPFSCFM